jgi:hypothetical protein
MHCTADLPVPEEIFATFAADPPGVLDKVARIANDSESPLHDSMNRFLATIPQAMREKICPTHGSGLLTASARKRRAREIIESSGADKPETLQASIASVNGVTFRQQSEAWLRSVRKRDVAPSTLRHWDSCLNTWLLPTRINCTPFGDFPLATIKRTVAQELIDQMVAAGLSPKSISNYRRSCGWFSRLASTKTGRNYTREIGRRWG